MTPKNETKKYYEDYLATTTPFLNSALDWLEKNAANKALIIKQRQASDREFFHNIFSPEHADKEGSQINYYSHLYRNRLSHLNLIYQCKKFDSFLQEKLSDQHYSEYQQDKTPIPKDKFIVIADLLEKSALLRAKKTSAEERRKPPLDEVSWKLQRGVLLMM